MVEKLVSKFNAEIEKIKVDITQTSLETCGYCLYN